jgi:hypothetical protein
MIGLIADNIIQFSRGLALLRGPEIPTAATGYQNGSSGRNHNVQAVSDGLDTRIAHSE